MHGDCVARAGEGSGGAGAADLISLYFGQIYALPRFSRLLHTCRSGEERGGGRFLSKDQVYLKWQVKCSDVVLRRIIMVSCAKQSCHNIGQYIKSIHFLPSMTQNLLETYIRTSFCP